MSVERIDHIIKEINSLDAEEIAELIRKMKGIHPLVERLREEEDDHYYYEMVNESLKEVWDNEEDDVYNDL